MSCLTRAIDETRLTYIQQVLLADNDIVQLCSKTSLGLFHLVSGIPQALLEAHDELVQLQAPMFVLFRQTFP
jgi:hypothetical protein